MSKNIIVKLINGDFRRESLDAFVTNHFIFEGEITCSDGDHTFEELYDHRITLFISLCHCIIDFMNLASECGVGKNDTIPVWRSKVNGDGTIWKESFIMGINTEPGKQITYHIPLERWEETNFAKTLDQAPPFDGHTSADVLERLSKI